MGLGLGLGLGFGVCTPRLGDGFRGVFRARGVRWGEGGLAHRDSQKAMASAVGERPESTASCA